MGGSDTLSTKLKMVHWRSISLSTNLETRKIHQKMVIKRVQVKSKNLLRLDEVNYGLSCRL